MEANYALWIAWVVLFAVDHETTEMCDVVVVLVADLVQLWDVIQQK